MGEFIAKEGDRVLYLGKSRPDWHGNPATVERVTDMGHVTMRFDRPHSGGSYKGTGFMLHELAPLVPGVDVTKPLLIRNRFGAYPAILIGVLDNGDIAVSPASDQLGKGWNVYTSEGKFVRAESGSSATTLENEPEPVITKGYINIGSAGINGGRGLVDTPALDMGKELGLATIEVTLTDGVVTDAKLIQPGNGKIKHGVVAA